MQIATKRARLPIVSLDDRYIPSVGSHLGISRAVDSRLQDAGYVSRVGYPPVAQQLKDLSGIGPEILLVDDVLFSGEMVAWLADQLKGLGIRIGGMVCGIAIGQGVERLERAGIEIEPTVAFEEVEDEICERDFAVVPGSGRRIEGLGANALYFDTVFGRPSSWASIPASDSLWFEARNYDRVASLMSPGTRVSDAGEFYGLPGTLKFENITQILRKSEDG